MRHVTLVVPCFDEAARLDVRALVDARLADRRLELVLVDDGSRDGTRAVLEGIRGRRDDTFVVACDRNLGKAEAVRRGVLDALGRGPDAVGYWDADLSTPLTELPAFVELLASRPELEIVIGSRVKLMGRLIERRAWRHYLGRAFATAASLTLDLPVYDTQCGAKLLRATPLLARVLEQPWRARWVFDVELLARYMALDPRGPAHVARSIYELPLTQWTHVPGSKLAPLDFAAAALDLAIINVAYRRR